MLGSLAGCRAADAPDAELRAVPHTYDEARVVELPIDDLSPTFASGSPYEGGPVLLLDQETLVIGNAPYGEIGILVDPSSPVESVTPYGAGAGEMEWVDDLCRFDAGFLAYADGLPPKLLRFSASGEYLSEATPPQNWTSVETVGGLLVGFVSMPQLVMTSSGANTMSDVKMLHAYADPSEYDLRWSAYPLLQDFAISSRAELANPASPAHQEIISVATAATDQAIYILNKNHDNLQVFGRDGSMIAEYTLQTPDPVGGRPRFEINEDGTTTHLASADAIAVDENGLVFVGRRIFKGADHSQGIVSRIDIHDAELTYVASIATDASPMWMDAQFGVLVFSCGYIGPPALRRIRYGNLFEEPER